MLCVALVCIRNSSSRSDSMIAIVCLAGELLSRLPSPPTITNNGGQLRGFVSRRSVEKRSNVSIETHLFFFQHLLPIASSLSSSTPWQFFTLDDLLDKPC